MDHRLPREPFPSFLHNLPKPVISACLLSIEKAKAIDISTIIEEYKVNGTYGVTSKNAEYSVDIKGGNCTCPYYTLCQIPCKHMFCIFHNDLPSTCTQCPHMTLDGQVDQDDHDFMVDQQDNIPSVAHSSFFKGFHIK